MAARRPSVGLDLGTSTTLVASTRSVVPIANEGPHPGMPSLVAYAEDGSVAVVERALAILDGQAIRSIKRAITENRETVPVELSTGVKDVLADDLIIELLRGGAARCPPRPGSRWR